MPDARGSTVSVGIAAQAKVAPDALPAGECLKDCLARVLPWWYDSAVPDLEAGEVVLVAAHGNSLRALEMQPG